MTSLPPLAKNEWPALAVLAAQVKAGETSAARLVRQSLERIAAHDALYASVLEVDPSALERAARLDAERIRTGPRSRLHGLPVLIKDNIAQAGRPVAGGARRLNGLIAERSAQIVTRFERCGAIVVGRTNMSELAYSAGMLGYSSKGGWTRNRHDLQRNASGSSSGAAVAVAAGFAPISVGTDTCGSVRGPAAAAGIPGFLAAHGGFAMDGIMPSLRALDSIGFLTRNVADCRLVLEETGYPLSGERDQAAAVTLCLRPELSGDITDALELAARRLQGSGHSVARIDRAPYPGDLAPDFLAAMSADFSGGFAQFVREYAPAHDPSDLLAAVAGDDAVNPALAAWLRTLPAEGMPGPDLAASRMEVSRRLETLAGDGLLAFPTLLASPLPIGSDAPEDETYRNVYPASFAGWPEVTVPVGRDGDGLPIAISLCGPRGSENAMLAAAERAIDPQFVN